MNKNDWSDIVKLFVWMILSVLLAFAAFFIFRGGPEERVVKDRYWDATRIVAPVEELNDGGHVRRPRQNLEAVESVLEPLEMPSETVEVKVVIENIRAAAAEVEYFDIPLSRDLQDHIFAMCSRYDVDAALVMAMIQCESSYVIDIVGDNGNAFGLMQIWPSQHGDRIARLGVTDLLDPYQNITVGVDLIAELIGMDRGTEWALMCYNGGFKKANNKVDIVVKYAEKVLNTRTELLVDR